MFLHNLIFAELAKWYLSETEEDLASHAFLCLRGLRLLCSPGGDLVLFASYLFVDSLYLLNEEVEFLAEFFDFLVHGVNECVAFLTAGSEEADVVFVGLDFGEHAFVGTLHLLAFVFERTACVLHSLLQVLSEVVETALCLAGSVGIVYLVAYGTILFVERFLVAERHVSYFVPLLLEFLDLCYDVFCLAFCQFFELGDDAEFLFFVGILFVACVGCGSLTGFEEVVACCGEAFPEGLRH